MSISTEINQFNNIIYSKLLFKLLEICEIYKNIVKPLC